MFNFRARTPRVVEPVARQKVLVATLPDGHTVEVLRVLNARARGLRLSVTERGARLTTPTRTSDARALAFVHEHAAWLSDQLAQTFHGVDVLRIGESATLPLRGAQVPVRWLTGRYLSVDGDGSGIEIALPAQTREAAVRRGLSEFYLAQARADVGRWLPRYLPGLSRAPRSISIRPLTSLWGSLAPDDRMRLDLALVLAPPAAFEYVLVHELCHLLQPNHSAAFWREVESRSPDWRIQRDFLRSNGRPLKAQLRALCHALPVPRTPA